MTQPDEGSVHEEETAPAADQQPEAAPAEPDAQQPDTSQEAPAEPSAEDQLRERTADLQRLQAEYVNYRKRVERDRVLARAQGEAAVLRSLLTVLDDIGRAAEHGELEGGFKSVADSLQSAVRQHRLEVFGATGDAFDPRLHEALFAAGEDASVDVTSVGPVVRTGYRIGDEVLRHAQVGVVEPAAPASPQDAATTESATDDD